MELIPTGRSKALSFQPNINYLPAILPNIINRSLTIFEDNSAGYIKDAFSANSTVYAIITIISRKFSTIPLFEYIEKADAQKADISRYKCLKKDFNHKALSKVGQFRKKSFEEVDNGKVSNMLDNPNKYQSRADFLEQAIGFRLITGECFIRVIRRGGDSEQRKTGEPLELEILPSQYMSIRSDGTLYGVKEYVFRIGTESITYQPHEIIHWKYGNPNVDSSGTHLHGLSPLRAGRTDVNANTSGKTAASHMFQNQGANGLISPKDNEVEFTEDQANFVKDKINEKINGSSNKGKTVSVSVPLTWQQIGMNAVDMSLIEANRLTKNDICALYNFPLNLIENTHSTLGNIENDNKRLVTGKIIGECESFEDLLNAKLVPMFGKDTAKTHLAFDYSSLPELQVDMEKMATVMDKAWYLSGNEKREVLNYDEDEDPNMAKIYIPANLVPLDQLNMPMGEPLNVDELSKAGVNDYR
jgi:HK97 family phage portal protein